MTEKELSSSSEKSPRITKYNTLTDLGEFNLEAAKAARAKEKELTREKDVEGLAYSLEKTNKYMEMMNEAVEKDADPAIIEKIAKKLNKALDSADKFNDTVGDKNFNRFMEENARPF